MITSENAEKLWNLIHPLKTGMLILNNDQSLHALPMHLVQSEFNQSLFFFTNLDSLKVNELKNNHETCIAFSCPKTQTYVSISGTASINKDKKLIDQFWNPFVAAWFPQGKDDPSVGLIQIDVYAAEYWDVTSSKVVQMFEYAKAAVTGTPPNMGQHEKI